MIKEKMVSLVNSKWFMNLIYCLICHGIPSNVVDTKFFWLFQAYSCFYIMQWGQENNYMSECFLKSRNKTINAYPDS